MDSTTNLILHNQMAIMDACMALLQRRWNSSHHLHLLSRLSDMNRYTQEHINQQRATVKTKDT